jgi:hypothetical protein
MGIEDITVNKYTEVEVYCTPEDLRDLANKMERHIKKKGAAMSDFREYTRKKSWTIVFCIDIDRIVY